VNLTQAVDYLKNRHNDPTTGYWDAVNDIYPAISSRCAIIAAIFGLIPKIDATIVTVAGTDAYTIPHTTGTMFISITGVLRDGKLLRRMTQREYDEFMPVSGTMPQGLPEGYLIYDEGTPAGTTELILVPTPNAVYDITIIGDKVHPFIGAGGTIDIPEALHLPMLDGVLSDMYTKYQNSNMATFFENKWTFHMKETFPVFKMRQRLGSRFDVLRDSDTAPGTGNGLR
jgi:hypothetical protein